METISVATREAAARPAPREAGAPVAPWEAVALLVAAVVSVTLVPGAPSGEAAASPAAREPAASAAPREPVALPVAAVVLVTLASGAAPREAGASREAAASADRVEPMASTVPRRWMAPRTRARTDRHDVATSIAGGTANRPARHRSAVALRRARCPGRRGMEGALRGRARFRHRGVAGRGGSRTARRPAVDSRCGRAGDRRRGPTRWCVHDRPRAPGRRGSRDTR